MIDTTYHFSRFFFDCTVCRARAGGQIRIYINLQPDALLMR